MLRRQMLISMEGHSVADFDTQSANTNRNCDYDIFYRQINMHLEINALVSNDAIIA
jgi:hypothetical protein